MQENNNKISKKGDLGCKKILKNGVWSKMDDGKCTLVRSYIKKTGRIEKFSSSEEMFKSLGIWAFMYEIRMTKTFRKDAERCRKRGYDM